MRFQVVIIDEWKDNSLVMDMGQLQDYDPNSFGMPVEIWRATFNNSLRYSDFCGNPTFFDNIGVADAWAQHNSTLAKFRVRVVGGNQTSPPTPIPDLFWGVREALIRVGTCGRHCKSCTSPLSCQECYAPYVAVSGTCTCDPSLGLGFPTKTGCSHPCSQNEFYDSSA